MKMKKQKMFGFGAVALMFLVAIVPSINGMQLSAEKMKEFEYGISGVGDWDLKSNKIMISKKLNDIDKLGVIIHEFIEMLVTTMYGIPDCCQKEYSQTRHGCRNEQAHNIANKIEKYILKQGGYNWKKHEKRIKLLIERKTK